MPRLTMLLQPCSGTCERLITGVPSTSSSVALRVAYCSTSGTSLTSTHSRAISSRIWSIFLCASSGSAMNT